MIPEGFAAFVSFLLLVAPGLLFEVRRESRRASREESSFREVSRVALASLGFTGLSLAILAGVRARYPSLLPDPGAWLRLGFGYVRAKYRLVVAFFLAETILALILALLFDGALRLRKSEAAIDPSASGWTSAMRRDIPKESDRIVRVELHDQTEYAGMLRSFSADLALQDRELVLEAPLLRKRAEEAEFGEIAHAKRLVIPARDIRALWVMLRATPGKGKN